MNADFSQVRIHEGSHVVGIGAVAYADGSNIHFASGEYNPHSAEGRQLLAHELAHVVQQRAGVQIPKLTEGTVNATSSPAGGE